MNQILQTEKKKNNGPADIRKIVKFFAIVIILFAIILIGIGSYTLITQPKDQTTDIPQVGEEKKKPEVNVNREEDDIIIEVAHEKPIEKIVYSWNEEEENTIEGENKTTLSERIELPTGTNILNLTVIDIEGTETKFQKEYIVEGEGKPIIDLTLTKDNKIKITVEDTINLNYMVYTWNNGEEIKVEADEETQNRIEKEIEIPLGQNTLKVQAINENNVSTVKELEVKGVKRPVVTLKKDGDTLIIRAEDESGMKLIDYTLNGQKYQINYGDKKVIEYKQKLQPGENIIELKAENKDGGITQKRIKCIN